LLASIQTLDPNFGGYGRPFIGFSLLHCAKYRDAQNVIFVFLIPKNLEIIILGKMKRKRYQCD